MLTENFDDCEDFSPEGNEVFVSLTTEYLEEYFKTLPNPLRDLSEKLNLRDVTTEELALVLGITDRRISQLWKAGDIPEPRQEGRKHMFPLLESVNMYIQFIKRANR